MVSKTQKPKREYYGVVEWKYTLDPWHKDAFPDGLKHVGTAGERKEGWMGYDWCGNPLIFVPDGTEEA